MAVLRKGAAEGVTVDQMIVTADSNGSPGVAGASAGFAIAER